MPQSVLKHTIYFQSKEITQRGKVYKLQTKLLEFVDTITCTVRVVSSFNWSYHQPVCCHSPQCKCFAHSNIYMGVLSSQRLEIIEL